MQNHTITEEDGPENCRRREGLRWLRDARRTGQRKRSMIRILASVSGGVTGSRQSWLKSNGEIRDFESLTEAQQVAAELNARRKARTGSSSDTKPSKRGGN
jgi:hypothetical protein